MKRRATIENDSTLDTDASRRNTVWRALEQVTDPEIPVITVVEMGMIADVRIGERGVEIDMTPTFAGCPALDVIRDGLRQAVLETGEPDVTVRVVFDPPWTTDRISEVGRKKLKAFGLAPPGARCTGGELPNLENAACPFCDSTDTELDTIFGPTLCRSTRYCKSCQQPFEHFKAV